MSMMKQKLALLLCLVCATSYAQTLVDSFKPQVWGSYIFVSTTLPKATLIQLAREAQASKSLLVFNGMGSKANDLPNLQKLVAEVSEICCKNKQISWVIHPKLFDRYAVRSTPSFVLAKGEGNATDDYAIVSGDMSLAHALKFMAQGSKNQTVRDQAAVLYTKTFLRN